MRKIIILFLSVFLIAACSNGEKRNTEQILQNEQDIIDKRRAEREAQDNENEKNKTEIESVSDSVGANNIHDELDTLTQELKEDNSESDLYSAVDLQNFYYEPKLEDGKHKLTITFGSFELSNYYNYGFSETKDTHQAFKIGDVNGEIIYAYVARDSEEYEKLMEDINNNNTMQFFILLERNDVKTGSQHMAEIVSSFNKEN